MPAPTIAWSPSLARTVQVRPFAVVRGLVPSPQSLSWPAKPPAADLDVTLDLGPWMADAQDSLRGVVGVPGVSPAASSQDLGIVWCVAAGQKVVLLVSGGVAGTTYTITIPVQTACGRTQSWSVLLPVDMSTASATPTSPSPAPTVTDGAEGFIRLAATYPTASTGVAGATYLNGGSVQSSDGTVTPLDFSFANLPLADPGISGRLWSSGGQVVISAGPLPPQTSQDAVFAGLPTTDPHQNGEPWSNGGYLTISAG